MCSLSLSRTSQELLDDTQVPQSGTDLFTLPLPLSHVGPKELLDDTQVAQPALLVAGLAAAVAAKQQEGVGTVAASCAAAAGLSLGEYSALVWAGALSFEDGIKVG